MRNMHEPIKTEGERRSGPIDVPDRHTGLGAATVPSTC